jgi:hypothetical protein
MIAFLNSLDSWSLNNRSVYLNRSFHFRHFPSSKREKGKIHIEQKRIHNSWKPNGHYGSVCLWSQLNNSVDLNINNFKKASFNALALWIVSLRVNLLCPLRRRDQDNDVHCRRNSSTGRWQVSLSFSAHAVTYSFYDYDRIRRRRNRASLKASRRPCRRRR